MDDSKENITGTGDQGARNGGNEDPETRKTQSPLLIITRWVGSGAVAFFTLKALFSGAFWTTVLGVILTICCYYLIPLAWVLGDAFRRFVRPDFILTSSTSELFYQRIFWMIGPQLVGVFLVCTIPMVILNKATEATRMSKEIKVMLKKADKFSKDQSVEMDRMIKEESDKKAEDKEKEGRFKKEYATLVDRSDRYSDWADEQRKAYQQLQEDIERFKTSRENTQQEVESREEFEKRQAINCEIFDKKLKSKYGKVLEDGKCFVIRNTCYLEQVHLNKEGSSLSQDEKSLLFKVKSVYQLADFDEQHYRHAPVTHVNLLGKVYEYDQNAIVDFNLSDAKKVLDSFGGTFSEPGTVTEHLRIDEIVRVRSLFCIEHLGYAVVKRGAADKPIPSERMLIDERERQTNERINTVTKQMNIDR